MRRFGHSSRERTWGRALVVVAIAGLSVSGSSAAAGAGFDAGAVQAALTCDRADGPGRVRCEVEARVPAGQSISWGDVELLKTPAFTMVLRGRIGPHDATLQDPEVWRWAFALAARQKGTGVIDARIRIVVCEGKTCTPVEVPVSGKIAVGE